MITPLGCVVMYVVVTFTFESTLCNRRLICLLVIFKDFSLGPSLLLHTLMVFALYKVIEGSDDDDKKIYPTVSCANDFTILQ
jgi:hypothetical protein